MGGTLVMLLAAREAVDASVIYYGFPRNAQRSEMRPHGPIEEAAREQRFRPNLARQGADVPGVPDEFYHGG
jgi:dienelactone hydrolase